MYDDVVVIYNSGVGLVGIEVVLCKVGVIGCVVWIGYEMID